MTFFEGLFSVAQCGGEDDGGCRDDVAALRLKEIAIASILVAGVVGVGIPLVGRSRITDSGVFLVFKAFAAGVVLATGFVHMLPDGEDALTDPCLPDTPWKEFPFAGFVAMAAALCTLVLDFLGTQYYEQKRRRQEENGGDYHEIEDGNEVGRSEVFTSHVHGHGHDHVHSHTHSHVVGGETSTQVRHVVASQILELGIVSHSIIIGLSLGVSNSPCMIRPLIAALSFHQFFEGIALGGCISQADFNSYVTATMACFFAVTTPAGVAVGASLASLYNANSPRALVVEGLLDCVSAGILIYMALVELIAADFLSRNVSTKFWPKLASFVALFLGAASMSLLAIWA